MFVRIVKMTFQKDRTEEFLKNFHENKNKIKGFKGCIALDLYRDRSEGNIFFTYSWWQKPEDLENYRNSPLFKEVWAKTKVLFSEKPEAWSLDRLERLS